MPHTRNAIQSNSHKLAQNTACMVPQAVYCHLNPSVSYFIQRDYFVIIINHNMDKKETTTQLHTE